MKRVLFILLAVALLLSIGVFIMSRRQAATVPAQVSSTERELNLAGLLQPNPIAPPFQRNGNQRGDLPLQDPVARDALSLVGIDSKADEYWVKAINNPALPAKERRELIEDLNQDGFADRKNLTAQDLPLILNRLALIEKLDAMDDVNAAAIQEAHKDLVKMRDRLRPPPGQ